MNLENYPTVDLILGKQKHTIIGRGTSGVRYAAFPKQLQQALRRYVDGGGSLIVSGAYVASDLFDSYSDESDRAFAEEVLNVRPATDAFRPRSGKISTYGLDLGNQTMQYSNNLNEDIYIVEKPDVLEPFNPDGQVLVTFSDSGNAAGISTRHDKGSVTVLSVPVESVKDDDARGRLIKGLIDLGNRK